MPIAPDLRVKLAPEALAFVQEKVSNGEFISENEVIAEGVELPKFAANERARWEREVLLPAHDRLIADPASAVTDDQRQASLQVQGQQITNNQ